MKTREETLKYATSVYQAIHGSYLHHSQDASDHPYNGASLDTIKELVNGDVVKAQVKTFEKNLKAELQSSFDNLEVNCPVKITKGSKDKRGLEGFIIHAQEPIHGSTGKALFVYDVINHKSCFVRSSAVKLRLPKYGERGILKETYRVGKELVPHYTTGKEVQLKADLNRKGYLVSDAKLDSNLLGNGFYQCQVTWNDSQSPQSGTYILTELNLL